MTGVDMHSLLDMLAGIDALLIGAVESPWMLAVLAVVCVIDGVFPPVPSEIVLLTAATVTWSTNPHLLVLVVTAAAFGAWIGDNIAYGLGRRMGLKPLPWMRRGGSATVLDRVSKEFHRRPDSIILTGRFVPVARILVNMTAGATRLPYRRFLLLSLASAWAWAIISAVIAVLIGAVVTSHPLLGTVIAVGVALAGGIIVDRVLARRRRVER